MIFNADHKNDIQLTTLHHPYYLTITANTIVVVVVMMMMGETMTTHKTDLHCCAIIKTSFFFNLRGYLLWYKNNQMFFDNKQTSTSQT